MQIGRVAKKIGLTPYAIRFYERNPLLPRPPQTAGGFRQYANTDVETLGFIRRVQGLGSPARRQLKQKLSEVHRKLLDLQNLEGRTARGFARLQQETKQEINTVPTVVCIGGPKHGNEK